MTENTEKLKRLGTDKLLDVVKNYRQYGYDDNIRTEAISILSERGIIEEELKLTGNLTNHAYDFANDIYKSFSRNSAIAFILYGCLILTEIVLPILRIDTDTIGIGFAILILSICLLYLLFLLKSFLDQNSFYKAIGQNFGSGGALVYLLVGILFYFFVYFYFRKQMKEKLDEIR